MEFKYYLLKRKGDQSYPMLRIADRDYDEDGKCLKVYLEINTPRPKKPVLADFLYAPKTIVSKRIAEVMQSLNMEGVQFIPTQLSLPKGEIIEDYVCVLVDNNTYVAMDKEKSVYTKYEDEDDDEEDVDYTVEKVVLDRAVLSQIPLNKRLGFRLREAPGYYLFHHSVIEAISALNPTGVFYVDVEEYEF
ncbi:hypothetical protein FACS1894158_09850 [Betaproteobacteria bacterium]|nr:hypothetical protein FACS1894158_09850 [Betaproteobacteria bacterium]